MNPYREMLLVSLEEYTRLRNQVLTQNSSDLMQNLTELKEKTDHLPADQRIALEGEVLRQHIKQPESTPAFTPLEEPQANVDEDDAVVFDNLNRFTKTNKIRANQVYQHLKAYKVQWNKMGQMLDNTGLPISNANIVELIDYVTNTKRITRQPAGFSVFVQLLRDSQLPRNYYSTLGLLRVDDYKHLEEIQEDLTPSTTDWKRIKLD